MRESNAWADNPANHGLSGEILARRTKISPDLVQRMVRSSYGEAFEPVIAQPLLDAALKYGSIAKPMSAKELLAPR